MRICLLWLCSLFAATVVLADPVDCGKGQCDLLKQGAYPAVVIGTIHHVGTDDDMGAVYQWASKHHFWNKLPKAKESYLTASNVIVVNSMLPGGASKPMALLMGRDEFSASHFEPGDLIRYAPHRKDHEAPQGDATYLAVYWGATGCVATLCKGQDKECLKRYKQGFFSRQTGKQIDALRKTAVAGGTTVDTTTWLPNQS